MKDEQYERPAIDKHFFQKDSIPTQKIYRPQRPQQYTRERINLFMKDPNRYSHQLQSMSLFMYHRNGHYYRLVQYLANLLTLDHVISPMIYGEKMTSATKAKRAFERCAMYVKKMNIKYNKFNWRIRTRIIILLTGI